MGFFVRKKKHKRISQYGYLSVANLCSQVQSDVCVSAALRDLVAVACKLTGEGRGLMRCHKIKTQIHLSVTRFSFKLDGES